MPSNTKLSTTLRFLSLPEQKLLVLTELLRLLTWFMLAFQDGCIGLFQMIVCFSIAIAMTKDFELGVYEMSAVSTELDELQGALDEDKKLYFQMMRLEVRHTEPFGLWYPVTKYGENALAEERRLYKTDYARPDLLRHMDEILSLKVELMKFEVILALPKLPDDFKKVWRYLPHVAKNCDMESKACLLELLLPHLFSFKAGGFWAKRLGVPEGWQVRFAVGYSVINWLATFVNSTLKNTRNQRIKAAGFRVYFPSWASINPLRLRTCLGTQMFSRLQFWPSSNTYFDLVRWLVDSELSIRQLKRQLGDSAPPLLKRYHLKSEQVSATPRMRSYGDQHPLYIVSELSGDEEQGQAAVSSLQKKTS